MQGDSKFKKRKNKEEKHENHEGPKWIDEHSV